MKEIRFTKSKAPYGWMGNMSRFPITYMGKTWGSTEHLFQAMRFGLESAFAEVVRQVDNPFQAKQVAKANREHMVIEPCSEADLANMEICLRVKIETYQNLKAELITTGKGTPIYEDVTFRGDVNSNLFWGAMKLDDGTWKGKNIVGEMWMKIRDEHFPNLEPTTELEIERRFLMKCVPPLEYSMKYDIQQHYLSPIGAKDTERVRGVCTILNDKVVKDEWIHTIKEPTEGLGMNETEQHISWDAFKVGKDNSDRSIFKMRHILEHFSDKENNLKWEIDEFQHMNLVIAEIEVPSEDYELEIPDTLKGYILMEITGMHQFSNSNLAE